MSLSIPWPKFRPLACVVLACGAVGALAGPAEDVRAADAAAGTGDVFTAMSLLRKAADQGHPLAQARLADLLHAAEFDAEAIVLYRRAAEQGEPAGEFGMGRMYANGTGLARDAARALEWYRKAEGKGYPPALDALARAYRAGDLGLPKDPGQAAALDARRSALLQAGREPR